MRLEAAATELLRSIGSVAGRDELLSEFAQVMCHYAGSDSCDIFLLDASEGLLLAASTFAPEMVRRARLGKGVGIIGKSVSTLKPIFISRNAGKQACFQRYPMIDEEDCEALAVLPLVSSDQGATGAILFRKIDEWRQTMSSRRTLKALAEMVANSIAAWDHSFHAGAQSNRLGALSEVSRVITKSPYVEEILQLLVIFTAQQFNYVVCTVRLLDENRGELVLRATQAPAKAYQRKRAIKLGESMAGKAMETNRPIIVRDVQVDKDYIGHDLAVEQGLRSMICVPLSIGEKTIGVMSCYTSEVRDFLQDEVRALETLAKQAAVSIEHAKLQVRNTLMQEMHHRVKNNLQQVASLLRLQMRMSTYKSLEEALNDTLSRILAIASVHDLLSREDLDHVGVRSIAETLVHHQQSSLILPDREIAFEVRGDDATLSMTQATQVALLLNELIQNAVEHGFHETLKGEVHVNIEVSEEEVSMWVSNSGDQVPAGFDPALMSNLGLKIVDNLTRGLGGRFKMSEVLGWTVAEVRFPRVSGD